MFKKIEHPVPKQISLSDVRMCIVGACRNVGHTLPNVLEKLEEMETWWKECKVVVYENDSTDNTASILNNWINNKPNRKLIQESNLNSKYPKRTERLAYIRNTLIGNVPTDFDYCLMVDLDDVFTNPLSKEAFQSCFALPFEWDAVAGNSPYYYDIWALRVKELCEFDCVNNGIGAGLSNVSFKTIGYSIRCIKD
jgi:glycosyltransferase involved in cell wall biosynthesis